MLRFLYRLLRLIVTRYLMLGRNPRRIKWTRTGIMFVKRDGSVLWFKDSKARKNMLKLGRNPRRMKWTRRYVKGGIN